MANLNDDQPVNEKNIPRAVETTKPKDFTNSESSHGSSLESTDAGRHQETYNLTSQKVRMQPNDGADFVSVRISEKLACLSRSQSESFIFKVHKQLRGINEKAYEPEIVSVGAYHHGKESLQMMEEHKLQYLQLLLNRKDESNADRYILALRSLELEARRCYAEPITQSTNEFVEMMLLDGCFIIEVIRKSTMAYLRDEDDPIFKMAWIRNSLRRDLMLFENQLPFFILCKLFDMTKVPNQRGTFINLAQRYFRSHIPGRGYRKRAGGNSNQNIKHLLGLIHNNWLPSLAETKPDKDVSNKTKLFIPSATELLEAGIRMEKAEKLGLFDIKFRSGKMQIPPLDIDDSTESIFRNLIAYEQCCPGIQLCYITDYTSFLDCLISSSNDVKILCRCGIIENWLGDEEVVSNIFNKIGDAVTFPIDHFQYANVVKEVNEHCSKRRNRWMAKLRRNYLNSPWAVLSVVAAFILLALTFTQTYFAVFPLKK